MAATFGDLWRRALAGTLTDRSISINLGRGNITALEAQALRGVVSGSMTPAEALNVLATAGVAAPVVTTAPAGAPVTIEGVMRMIAAGTAFNADVWRKFIGEGPGRALPELESRRPNVGNNQNITFMRQWWSRIEVAVATGNMAALVAEAEAPLANGGWTSGDLKFLYKVIAHSSQLNIFLGEIAAAKVNEKNITDAIGKNFGVYSNRNQSFERWGQTWGAIVQSFLGLVGLVKKIREGSLESKDVWDYRDKEAFQATFEELEDQQYIQDLRAWDPDEVALLHPQDLAENRPAGEPLFWSEPLALYMTEEVLGGVIVVTKDNFLRHKDLAEEVRTKQKAIRRALHVVEHYVDEPQRSSFLPDLKLSSIAGLVTGLVVGAFGAVLVGLPMDQGRSYIPVGILALVCWWAASQLRRRLGVVESLLASITALVGGFGTIWIVGSTKATYLRKGLPMVQANLAILTKLFKLWGWTLPITLVLFLIIRKSKGD